MNTPSEGDRAADRTHSPEDREPIFQETQRFPLWGFLILAGTWSSVAFILTGLAWANSASAPYASLFLVLVTAFHLAILSMYVLKTRIDGETLDVQLGIFRLFWDSIPLSEIHAARVVTYRPIRDAGGWGMRSGYINGESCAVWNARRNQGVLVKTAKGCYLIGSQRPEELLAALQHDRAEQPI